MASLKEKMGGNPAREEKTNEAATQLLYGTDEYKRITLRIPVSFYAQVERISKIYRNTVTGTINKAIQNYIEENKSLLK